MAKRKGKPKAKTKHHERMEDKLFSQSDGMPTIKKPIETEVSWNECSSRPIIRSATGKHDYFFTHTKSTLQPVANHPVIAVSAESSQSTSNSSNSSSSCSLANYNQQSIDENNLQDSIRVRSASANERISKNPAPDCGSTTSMDQRTTNNIDDCSSRGVSNVKANFFGLIRYNKIQSFYLGALIYSVINLVLLLQFIVQDYDINEPIYNLTNQLRQTSNELKQELILPFRGHAQVLATSPESNLASDDEKSLAHNKVSNDKSHAFVLLLVLLPLSLLMLIVIILNLLEFNLTKWHSLGSNGRLSNVRSYLELFGSLLAILLLVWPVYMQIIVFQFYGYEEQEGSKNEWIIYMPISSMMIIIYSVFALLQDSIIITKLLCALCVLPPIGLHLIKLNEHQSDNNGDTRARFAIALILIALVAGLIKCLVSMNANRRTFKGSNELIEAKVSLEQQRQQQETLLLSVLPAYVAEQVKRTMVKKMTNPDTGNSPVQTDVQQPTQSGCSSSAMNSQEHKAVQQPGTTTTKTFDQQQQHKRSSLAKLSKSGTSYLVEAVISSTSAALKQFGQQAQDNKLAQSAYSANFYPTSNFTQPPGQARRGFNELYIRTYNNVSLLYGDIVGFTRLCTQLSSSELVRVLNDLFSHFDRLAEQHKIMRIKILGDCYYGVSGIPEFAVMGAKRTGNTTTGHHHYSHQKTALSCIDKHAINCVNMGLDMIQYIRCLNIERASERSMAVRQAGRGHSQQHSGVTADNRPGFLSHSASVLICAPSSGIRSFTAIDSCPNQVKSVQSASPEPALQLNNVVLPAFELNMRIGVHTGHIHSGVIGLKKWQFDVWSNDVSIAMHCESSGVAGRVQVTEATVQHLHGEFTYEPAPRSQRDSYLADKSIRTYLVCERVSKKCSNEQNTFETIVNKQKTRQFQSKPKQNNRITQADATDEDKIRAATIGTIKQILLAGEMANSNSMNAYALALDHQDLEPISLKFRDDSQEKMFTQHPVSRASFLAGIILPFLLVYFIFKVFNPYWLDTELATSRIALVGAGFSNIALFFAVIASFNFRSLANQLRFVKDKRATIVRRSKTPYIRAGSIIRADKHSMYLNEDGRQRDALRNKLSIHKLWASLQSFAQTKLSLRNTSARSFLITLVVFIVILCQFSLSITSSCNKQQQADKISLHMQVTVIMIIFTLDIISPNIINYRYKSSLILTVMLLYIIVLSINLPLAVPGHVQQYQETSPTEEMSPMTVCDLLFKYFGQSTSLSAQDLEYKSKSSYDSQKSRLLLAIQWSNGLLLLVLALWSLSFQRQIEYSLHCNFLWRNKLNVDHEELEYISGINKVLLENILPSHVVQHYLTQPVVDRTLNAQQEQFESSQFGQQQQSQHRLVRMSISHVKSLNSAQLAAGCELYHEQHDSVAVMFASIPHFYEFYDETDISKQGLGCIALLNEIICDFDKLLLKNKFSRIEKIKTIGSTYMAAAGLRPLRPTCMADRLGGSIASDRNGSVSQQSVNSVQIGQQATSDDMLQASNNKQLDCSKSVDLSPNDQRPRKMSQQKMNLICMVQFASSLMTTLNGINKQSFQVFKLRVGVNTGPVIAGIIGAQRPFYDIWGDCVNIASRMESLGEVGRIQVEEKTAKLLMECLCTDTYSIECRGPIDVKGKGGMVTYFVDRKQQHATIAAPGSEISDIQLHNPVQTDEASKYSSINTDIRITT